MLTYLTECGIIYHIKEDMNMFEVMKSFILFGVIENFIVFMFLAKVCKVKIRYIESFYLIPIFLIVGCLNIPFCKQIFGILIISIYLYKKCKIDMIKAIGYTLLSFLYLLCVEMMICAPLDLLNIIDLTKL